MRIWKVQVDHPRALASPRRAVRGPLVVATRDGGPYAASQELELALPAERRRRQGGGGGGTTRDETLGPSGNRLGTR